MECAVKITLLRADFEDSDKLYSMQKKGFEELLEKYQDFETNPATESLERVKDRLDNEKIDCYFVDLNGESIGYIRIYRFDEFSCRLSQMAIMPNFQGNGYAQQAIHELEALYPHIVNWELDTIKQESKLCYLYEKMGYQRMGKEEKIKDGMDIVFYRK